MADFRVLGPVEAVVDGRRIELPAAKPRALLAALLLNRNRVVGAHELVDALWDDPPATAAKAVQGYVSQLRRALGSDRLETKPPGYSLRVEPGELDVERFESLVAEGRAALSGGDPETAASALRAGLELWRGPPLEDFDDPFAREARRMLDESRLAALEARVDADLALGRHVELVPELEQLVAAEPYRERPRAQLMLALYRSGRQADALELYRRTRSTFNDELGIEPGAELRELETAILRQDAALQRPAPRAAQQARESQRRRRFWPVAAAVALVAGAVAVAAVVGGGSSSSPPLRPFVVKLENFLRQSREGRREVRAAIAGAAHCTLSREAAAARLTSVQLNRQSLLQQLAALDVPDQTDAVRASDRLQRALQGSIAADWRYRDWLRASRSCPPRGDRADLIAAGRADARATSAKRAFVTAFNPLARRFGQEVWTAGEF